MKNIATIIDNKALAHIEAAEYRKIEREAKAKKKEALKATQLTPAEMRLIIGACKEIKTSPKGFDRGDDNWLQDGKQRSLLRFVNIKDADQLISNNRYQPEPSPVIANYKLRLDEFNRAFADLLRAKASLVEELIANDDLRHLDIKTSKLADYIARTHL